MIGCDFFLSDSDEGLADDEDTLASVNLFAEIDLCVFGFPFFPDLNEGLGPLDPRGNRVENVKTDDDRWRVDACLTGFARMHDALDVTEDVMDDETATEATRGMLFRSRNICQIID